MFRNVQRANWYEVCFEEGVFPHRQTNKLVRKVLCLSAILFSALLVSAAVVARHDVSLPAGNFLIYTYQNPFDATPIATAELPEKGANDISTGFPKWERVWGLLGWGLLGAATVWFLRRERIQEQHVLHTRRMTANATPKLTIQKRDIRVLPVVKRDVSDPVVFDGTTVLHSFAQRRIHAPCRSRFRSAALGPRQTQRWRLS